MARELFWWLTKLGPVPSQEYGSNSRAIGCRSGLGSQHTVEQVVEVADGAATNTGVALEQDSAVLVCVHALDVEGALVVAEGSADLRSVGCPVE